MFTSEVALEGRGALACRKGQGGGHVVRGLGSK